MVTIPWPIANSPGIKVSEGAGRLINVFPEQRGENAGIVWRRAPGATVFARQPSAGSAVIEFTAIGVSSVVNAVGEASIEFSVSGVGESA